MSDRTSAEIFYYIFKLIDECVEPLKRGEIARKFWALSRNYDFSPYQLGCDDILARLGLARKGVDPRHGEECMLYGPDGDE